MTRWLTVVLRLTVAGLRSRRNLVLENLALRHQLLVLSRGSNRPRLMPLDRALWAWLSHAWDEWKTRLCLVQPSTVIRWHRAGSPYVERLIGSVRRDCLDHVIVLNRRHLHRVLESYFAYYHTSRTHLGLNKDATPARRVQPSEEGKCQHREQRARG